MYMIEPSLCKPLTILSGTSVKGIFQVLDVKTITMPALVALGFIA